MKKLLLFLIAASFVIGATAQTTAPAKMDQMQKKLLDDSQYQRQVNYPAEFNYTGDVKEDVTRIDVGTAHSQRSFRREECRLIDYNPELDLLSMYFILDEETYPAVALSIGSVGAFYSVDHGQTWMGPILLSDFSDVPLRNYYLSGTLYNPSGNTVVEDAYGVTQAVATDDALVLWNNQAFGASTLGGANYFTEYFTNPEPDHDHDGYFSQFKFTQIQDYIKAFNIWAEGPWAGFTSLGMEDIQGDFNGTGFDWELENSSVVPFPFDADPADGEAAWPGKWTFSDLAAGMAWSDDGMIGYTWMHGSELDNLRGVVPIIYRTDNGGNDWELLEYDFQDDEWQEYFQNGAVEPTDWLIYPARDINEEFLDFTIPRFQSSVGLVDSEGNLQLFGAVTSNYYDVLEGSYDYWEYWTQAYAFTGHIFKFEFGEELNNIMWVDTLRAAAAIDLTSGSNDSLYCGTSGWLRRLDLTKDVRSEEFFVTWTDTRIGTSNSNNSTNYLPDVMGWSFNSTTDEHTDAHCFTCGTLYENFYWFTGAAERAIYDPVNEVFTVPYYSAVTILDFQNNGVASADPVGVQYVTGIEFPAIVPIPVGVDELAETSSLSVSQNLPNPATGNTTIEISSETSAPVQVEVSNIIGQTVITVNPGVINGSMNVNLDVSNLEAGVYFYTVTIANERVSKRMIVR